MSRRYELADDSVVVVIGSGAGGGTVANELAQQGVDVVCLEAGQRLTLADVVNDPVAMDAKMGWHDPREGAPLWVCKTVGGTTMRWAGVTPRFLAHEFRAASTYGSLKDTTLIDWPLELAELAPFYDRAEQRMGVSGTNGMPPSFETGNFKVLKAGAERVGYQQITTSRTAINSKPQGGRPACRQIGFCYSGCAIGAKWSTLYTEVPAAEQTGHFELRTGAMAVKLNHDDAGRMTGVVYADASGTLHEQKARAVCVAGNVVETTRLLLNSASSRYPDGVGNAAGHLGRNYMRHATTFCIAIMPGPVHMNRGSRFAGIVLDERGHRPQRGFDGGYIIEAGADHPFNMALYLGGWGEEVAEFMEHYPYLAGAWVTGEDPPEARNRIYLHAEKKDEHGLPVPVIDYSTHANSDAMNAHAAERTTAMYAALGARRITVRPHVGGGCHNMGVARMSAKPDDGVTDRWGRVHEAPNLFVSDGSVFTSSAAANPTLTIVALALRQAGHIAEAMQRREL